MTVKPRLGLALGGGGALGWAHIGVIRALEDAGIEIDCVAGTSIGSIVGAAYLAGKIDDLEKIARDIDWKRLLRLADVQLSGKGLLGGKVIMKEFERVIGALDIEDLLHPFAAVAADLVSGDEVQLTSGSLTSAVRASFSIPGVFTPFVYQGRVLVDGGIINPLPITAVKALGADLVIAVDVFGAYHGHAVATGVYAQGAPPLHVADEQSVEVRRPDGLVGRFARQMFKPQEGRPSLITTLTASFALMMCELTAAKSALMPPDVRIVPPVRPILPVEFDRAEELIERGFESGRNAVSEVRQALEKCQERLAGEKDA